MFTIKTLKPMPTKSGKPQSSKLALARLSNIAKANQANRAHRELSRKLNALQSRFEQARLR